MFIYQNVPPITLYLTPLHFGCISRTEIFVSDPILGIEQSDTIFSCQLLETLSTNSFFDIRITNMLIEDTLLF
jgi:hypothetical protein